MLNHTSPATIGVQTEMGVVAVFSWFVGTPVGNPNWFRPMQPNTQLTEMRLQHTSIRTIIYVFSDMVAFSLYPNMHQSLSSPLPG